MNELSDKNKPRNLEDIFREGMGEVEISPSDRLWERIDHKLDTREAVFYKERMVWFQRLAAACVVLVLITGSYLFYNSSQIEKPQLVTSEKLPSKVSSETKSNLQGNSVDTKNSLPQVANNNLRTNENTIAAKTPQLPITRKNIRFNKVYKQSRNNERTIAENRSTIQTRKLIDVAESTGLVNKVSSPIIALINEPKPEEDKVKVDKIEQSFVKSWTGIANKTAISDTNTTTAINNSLPLASENSSAITSNETTKKQSSRWIVSGKYASHYFNQNIALAGNSSAIARNNQSNFMPGNTAKSTFTEAMQEYDKNTTSSFSYNTSLGAAYQLNNNWAIETGVDYTQNVATTSSSYVFNNFQASRNFNDPSPNSNYDGKNLVNIPTTALLASLAGPADANNVGVVKTEAFATQYRYRLIGIPVKVNYKTRGEKSFYFVSGGLLTNFLMQAHILSASPVVPDIKYGANAESPFNDLQMAGTISVGKGFRITKGFSLKAGLEASKYLTSLAANPEYSEGKHGKPYTIGIALSSSYSLGR